DHRQQHRRHEERVVAEEAAGRLGHCAEFIRLSWTRLCEVLTLASLLWLICQVAFSWWTTTKGCDWRSGACSPRPDSRSPRSTPQQNCSVSTLTTSPSASSSITTCPA